MSEAEILRPLDPGERFIWLVDSISSMNFIMIAELAGATLDEACVRRGLDLLQASHPLLASRVVEGADGTIAFQRGAGPIPLQVEDRGDHDWHEPIQAELETTFDAHSPAPARCDLLQLPGRTIISLTFHHVIADARSGTTLLKDLLRFCLRDVAPASTQAVPPPMHSLFPAAFQWGDHPDKAADLARRIAEDALINGAPSELPFLAHRETRKAARLRQIQLDADQGRRLQERCRAEGTTVHGAICAAQLIATQHLFDDADTRTLYLVCPADLRPHIAGDIEGQLSFCSTLLRSTYRVDGDAGFWALAREIGDDLRRRIERGDGHLTYAALPLDKIGPSGPAFDAFAGALDQMPAGSNVSNIGRVEPLDDCPEVTAISFALCAMPKHLASLNVSSYRDRLIINQTYDAAKLAPDLADRLARDLESLLISAGLPA